jgi:D-alanine-D-alanine ligase
LADNKKIKIALLLGGTSPERAVSKESSKGIYAALVSLGYTVSLIDPAYGTFQPVDEKDFFAEKDFHTISNRNYVEAVNSKLLDEIDLVFIGLHGKWGEDGTIQSLLELRGKKYTGSKVLSSSLAMDKAMSKILFRHYDIDTADWFAIDRTIVNSDNVSMMIKNSFGFPAVIKPNDQGSTFGLTICSKEEEVESAVAFALEYSDKIIVEDYIAGREVTVGIIDNKALPVLEIKPKHGLYDYECKYTSGMSEYIVPAEIPLDTGKKIQQDALKAFTALGCEGYARVDFRLSEDNVPYCLEVNTLPGMTSTSLVPKMAKAVGISFESLIERIVQLSIL